MSNTILIDDPADPRIAMFADLQLRRSSARHRDSFVVEGRWCVERLVRSNYRVLSLLIQEGKDDPDLMCMVPPETPIYSLSSENIRQLVGFDFHRGVMACGARRQLPDATALVTSGESPRIALALIGVSDHENLGSILRSAAALGVEHILIGPKTIDPFARRTIRVSMATVFQLKLYRLDRPLEQFAALQRSGSVRIIASTLAGEARPLTDFTVDDRTCILVVGNEAFGIDAEIQAIANDIVTIPMQMGTDSLNVSVAAAICMFELAKALRSTSAES